MADRITATLLACGALNASIHSHAHHFAQQQQHERHFLRRLRSSVCEQKPVEDNFLPSLHALLKPMFQAIAKHTHSAFYVKSACTAIADQLLLPHESEEVMCTMPLLEHEPYNLVEGEYINSLVYRLLQHGPELICNNDTSLAGAHAVHLATMEKELEDALATHRSNMAMEKLFEGFADRCAGYRHNSSVQLHVRMADVNRGSSLEDATETLPCTSPGGACALARAAVPTSEQMRILVEDALQRPPSCCSPSAGEDANGSCSVQRVLDAFGNDTLILLEVARSALVPLSTNAVCTVRRPGARAEWVRLDEATNALRKHLKPPDPSGLVTALTLGTIYHKLVPYCGIAMTDEGAWQECYRKCDSCAGAASTPVFDLIPRVPDISARRAQSTHGHASASALVAFRALEQHLTKLRTQLVELVFNFASYRAHAWDAPLGSFAELIASTHERLSGSLHGSQAQRLCELMEATLALPALLSHALHKLRNAQHELEVACIASPRWLSLSSAPPSAGLPAVGSSARQLLERVVTAQFRGDGGNLEIRV